MNESTRAVVARFFNVAESALTDDFVLPPERLTGSISRRVLHAAIKRMAGEDLPGVWTATTFGELTRGGAVATAAPPQTAAVPRRASPGANGANDAPAVGIDIEELAKLPWTGDPWNEAFYSENFTQAEMAYAMRQGDPRATLCGMWCAKEAAIKCAPEFAALRPAQIEVRHDDAGRPRLAIGSEEAACEISISHAAATAVAVCIRYPAAPRSAASTPTAPAISAPPENAREPRGGGGSVLAIVLSLAALALAIVALVR